jgi:hypothetical protein
MMPLTCAPLGHWALGFGSREAVVNRMIGCRLPRPARAAEATGVRIAVGGRRGWWIWDGGLAEATFSLDSSVWPRTPRHDAGLAIMPNGLFRFRCVFQPAGQGRFPVLGLAAGSGSPEGDLAADMCRRLTSCPCFTYNSPKNMTWFCSRGFLAPRGIGYFLYKTVMKF